MEKPSANPCVTANLIFLLSKKIRARSANWYIGFVTPLVANAEALSNNVMFFATSSFGHTPVKIKIGAENAFVPDPARLRPVNIEIPLLWILSRILSKPAANKKSDVSATS